MAKQPKKKTYDVNISGEYFAAVKGGQELKPYNVTVRMNDDHKEAGFLSVFKNLVAPRMMRQQYPDYGDHLMTHRIISIKDTENPDAIPNEPQLMTLQQLMAFIQKNELPVDPGLYRDEDELKEAVIQCLEDEDVFEEAQAKRRELRGANVALANALDELNPGISQGTVPSQVDTSNIDLSKVPHTDDAVLPKKPQKQDSGTDKITVDTTKGQTKVVGDDDFDL